MEHARQARLLTGFDGDAGAGDGRGGGHAAEEGQEDIADALRDELLIGVEGLAFHAGGGRAAQQALDHAEGGDGDDGGDEVREHIEAQAAEVQAVGEEKRAGNVADDGKLVQA